MLIKHEGGERHDITAESNESANVREPPGCLAVRCRRFPNVTRMR